MNNSKNKTENKKPRFTTFDERLRDTKVQLSQDEKMLVGRHVAAFYRHKYKDNPGTVTIDGVRVNTYRLSFIKNIDGLLFSFAEKRKIKTLYGIKNKKPKVIKRKPNKRKRSRIKSSDTYEKIKR